MPASNPAENTTEVFVPMGKWAVAQAPTLIRTLLGSCVGVVLYDRVSRWGSVAHIVLPDSRGDAKLPGKYADTAIPAMLQDLDRALGRRSVPRLCAKLVGGASMFQSTSAAMNIGKQNHDAVERILAELGIPIIARDLGGEAGRRLTLDTASGIVSIRVPGGADHEI
ncbi:MAG: chemotaxis protein CheD [Isosphaeraceae bacterium]|nr:chemotaxis protein CheD [Isosphaeraceae bacterium]